MTRFITYINEENIDKVREDINKLCKPYIRKLRQYKDNKFLFSGRKFSSSDVIKGKVRRDRKPKDTPLEIHELLDKQFYKEFGIKARSQSLFCVQKYQYTKSYGTPYYIFPIGDYTTIWAVRIDDLYEWLKGEIGEHTSRRSEFYHVHGDDIIDGWRSIDNTEEILDIIEDMDIPNYYSSRDYQKLSKDTNEIMLHCKEYIGLCHAFVHSNFNSIWELIDG